MKDSFDSGTMAGAGSFRCDSCGFAVALHELDPLPTCPECEGSTFRRALLFEEDHTGPGTHHLEGPPKWLEEARDALGAGGDYLAFEEDGDARVVPLETGWTRIGRSLSADVRFDDPTVSRRHALVYCDPDGGARVLDDRSLNGVFRNGDRVELAKLTDGDEIAVGRFSLFFLRAGGPADGARSERAGTALA